jgi:hypothetical protein
MSIALRLPVSKKQLKRIFSFIIFSLIILLLNVNISFAQTWNITGNANVTSSNFIGTTNGNPVLIEVNNTLMASFGLTNNVSLLNSTSSNYYSIAMGYQTTASGWGSTSMGNQTVANGGQSTAIGNIDTASGVGSFATGSQNKALGDLSIAAGNYSVASGWGSFAVGNRDTASGGQSAAMGNIARATQLTSFAIGNNTLASGQSAFVMGEQTVAPSYCETVIGSYNTLYTPTGNIIYNSADRLFSIGNGTQYARSNALTILKNGKTGLGTVTPTEILDIVGNVKFSGALMPNNTAGTAGQVLTSAGPGLPPTWTAGGTGGTSFSGITNYISKFTPTGAAIGSSQIYDNGSFVGLGTTTVPTGYLFAVNGKAIFNKVVVENYGNWADYVFQKDYVLPSLEDVEKYINQNQHLQGVPSACEVEKNGVDIEDNQVVLLKKVEELTLYVIDQNKKIEALQSQNNQLKEQAKEVEQNQNSQLKELSKEMENLKALLNGNK